MNQLDESSWKYWLLRAGLFISFSVIVVNLFKLTVIKSKYYQTMARDNRVLETIVPAFRGEIVDRKGRVIAKSVYENETLKRQYPYAQSTAFVSGYVGKVTAEDVKTDKCGVKLDNNEFIGKSGVEGTMDCKLKGIDGRKLVEVDAKGNYVRELGRQDPETGKTLSLSIDAYWQDKIYKLLDGRKAVVIISEPKTGKILNFVSSPAFDPNVFSYQQDNQKINGYLQDKDNLPLLNRIISARYEPGSVFKIVTATAGLESGVINKDKTYEDTGILKVGDYSYSNWLFTKKGMVDGMVNIVKAIQRSNDIFFYKLGGDLGVQRIKDWANKYGFGYKTGIELPGELEGVAPDETWKLKTKGENWYLGDTYHLSIGQGFLSVTPLQVNQMTDIIANKGVKCKMSLLKDSKPDCQSLNIKRENWESIVEGMKAACKPTGTAWPLFNFKTTIACKTGTAEVGDGSSDTHAWLTAFAPADDPQIAITVMVERGGEGSDVAAPIVGDILKDWFNEPDTLVPRYKDKVVVSE
ncbi:MAG: penicillin-binding transpeptidase domain-containing protein [Candidatus Shapirobacteria bacterium]